MKRWYCYWRGLRRLRYGWCPECASSPPKRNCRVCHGEHDYAYRLSPANRAIWHDRWKWLNQRSAKGFVCENCDGSGMDQTWHEGATCAEVHQCGYCMGMTDRPEPPAKAF